MTGEAPKCYDCDNFFQSKFTCKPYPEGMPPSVVIDGDDCSQFKPKK